MYRVTKHYPHELGLSACFRQWKADSHCRFLHGYPLAFTLTFECETLDIRNWVIDFGGLKPIKQFLEEMFDHKLLVAEDDPELDVLSGLGGLGLADVVVLPGVGCEMFARLVYNNVSAMLPQLVKRGREVRLLHVTCAEHGGNSATYIPD